MSRARPHEVGGQLGRAHPHGAELEDHELARALAAAPLAEQRRSRGIEAHQQGDQGQQRRQRRQQGRRRDQVGGALDPAVHPARCHRHAAAAVGEPRPFDQPHQGRAQRAARVMALDEGRPRHAQCRARRGIVRQPRQRLRERGAVLRRHHHAAARVLHDARGIAAHRGHHRAAAGEVVEELDRNGLAAEGMRARRRHAHVRGADHLDQSRGRQAGLELHAVQPRTPRPLLERGLGDAVAHQHEADVAPRSQPLGRLDQRLHAVHQPVGSGVEHGEGP